MLPALLLALREGIEIALLIGIVFSTLRHLKRTDLQPVLWYGVVSAAAVSIAVALALTWVGAEFDGLGEQIFEGTSMLVAAGLLSWMVFWVRKENLTMRSSIEANIQKALSAPGKIELFLIAFSGVLREGIELVLYLIAARISSAPAEALLGATIGLALAALGGWALFASSVRLNLSKFFSITNVLLIIFAAGLVGRAIHEFNETTWIPTGIDALWNLSPLLSEDSPIGQILTALVGYSSAPSLTMTIGYLVYLVGMIILVNKSNQRISQ